MTLASELAEDQQVPESVMFDLFSMEEERFINPGELQMCNIPQSYVYNLPKEANSENMYKAHTGTNFSNFATFGDMEDVTLNYNVNGPLKKQDFIPAYSNINTATSESSSFIKQEPVDTRCDCNGNEKLDRLGPRNAGNVDHRVSFTELDQILNCDVTFYEDMNLGVNNPLTKDIKVEYDSDPESYHSDNDSMDGGMCSDPFFQVQSEVVRQVKRDILCACTILDIPADPRSWSVEQVHKWVIYISHQYKLPMVNLDFFQSNGLGFTLLSEEEFKSISPESGASLYAHLDIWLNASKLEEPSQNLPIPKANLMYLNLDQRKVIQDLKPAETKIPIPVPIQVPSPSSSMGSRSPPARCPPPDSSHDSASFCSTSSYGSDDEAETGRPSIHLWQFLKELLLQPQYYGNCIRWLDRKGGVFKIEDSARVARLWGKRKNRPAMNYDKLSRSIRQYYKKGIIKKTENSKRLVYRFCHPYLL